MSVDVVIGNVAVLPLANKVGQLTDRLQRHIRLIKKDAIVQCQSLTCLDLVSDLAKTGNSFGGVHHHRASVITGRSGWPASLWQSSVHERSKLPNARCHR